MEYIKLAYLAEFAVAFNLAFGEFKQDAVRKKLGYRFESLRLGVDDPFLRFAENIKAGTASGLLRPTRLGKCIRTIQQLRMLEQPAGESYRAFRGFVDRAELFATWPDEGKPVAWWKRLTWSVPWALAGAMASWAYSKTEDWKYPSCHSAFVIWSAVALICVAVTVEATTGIAQRTFSTGGNSLFAAALCLFSSAEGFALLGALVALFVPRPLSSLSTIAIRRHPGTPRMRSYPFIWVGLTTLILLGITLGAATTHPANPVVWFFLFGFLAGATLLPVAMWIGFLSLEASLTRWADWIAQVAADEADKRIASLTLEAGPRT